MLKKTTLFLLLLTCFVSPLFSSGFSIYEQGAKATSMGGAFIAQANDASAVFYNPAGITALPGLNIALGTTLITTNFAFRGPANIDDMQYTEAEKGLFPPSHLYLTYQVSDKIFAGFGFYSLFGLASEWGSEENPWLGRQLATNSELQTFFLNPLVAYKVLDNLSIAAGLNIVQANVTMEKSVYFTPRYIFGESSLEANTMSYGFNLGIKYQPIEKLSVGAVYRSNVNLAFDDGDATFKFPDSGNDIINQEIAAFFTAKKKGSADLELPDLIGVGLAYSFTENLTFEFDYMQLNWSSYDQLKIEFDDAVAGSKTSVSERNYEDSYSLRFGMEYKIDKTWTLRSGYIWDRHAVPDEYVEPSLPESNRHNYTIGMGFNWDKYTVDAAYHIILQDDREVTNSIHDFNGEYTGLANLFGLSLGYSF